jgi:hypothetical protein
MAARAINRNILSSFHRKNSWLDFFETSQEYTVPSLVVHIAGMFRFAAQKWLRIEKSCLAIKGQTAGLIFPQNSQEFSTMLVVLHITACTALLHKMAVRAIKGTILFGFHRSSYWWDFNELHMSDHTLFWETYVFVTKTLLVKYWVKVINVDNYVSQNFWETLLLLPSLSIRPLVVHPSSLSLFALHRSNYWSDFNQTLQE